jgi:hypothetical protein
VPAARRVVLCALLALVCLLGCQSLLGDFEIGDATNGADSCEGNFRCSESWLYCENESDGSWTQIDSCGTADQCDSTLGLCTVCDPGDHRCNGAKLETCKADRTGWTVVQTCATANECNLNSRTCRACTPGEAAMCAGPEQTELRQCGDDLAWHTRDTCATKELCAAAVEASANPTWDGKCAAPGCPAAGLYVCEGENLLRCPPSLTGYVLVDTCATEELCAATAADPQLADAVGGKCVMPVCSPAGAYRCAGDALEQCLEDQLGWGLLERCVLPFQCNTNEQACAGPCKPGDRQCNGAALELCGQGQLWEQERVCASGPLCQVAEDPITGEWTGTCLEPACPLPGGYRCTGSVLELCSDDQTEWRVEDTCASSALCNETDGRCEPPSCEPGELLCSAVNPSELMRCRDDLTDWESAAICSSTQSCNTDPAGPACLDQCPEPPLRCNGNGRESCSGVTGMPVWSTETTCRSRELCQCAIDGDCLNGTLPTDPRCGAPVCGDLLGGSRCVGTKLQLCLPGRNGFDAGVECGAGLCVPGQPAMPGPYFDGGYCAVCSVGSERSCSGSSLRSCSSDRRNWATTTPCGALGCRENGTNDYCNECIDGEKRCSGSGANMGLQTCSQGRWGAAVACAASGRCQDSGSNDYCADCVDGEKRCSGTGTNMGLQTCSLGRWGAAVACAAPGRCQDSGSNDYCADCVDGEKRCSGTGTTMGLQTCSQGRWGTAVACAAPGRCQDSGSNDYCADCIDAEKRCTGTGNNMGLQSCSLGRWDTAVACMAPGRCEDSGTNDYCAHCTPDERQCVTGGIQTCNAQRRWGATTACAAGLGCMNSGTADYCIECSGSETRCNSGALQTCTSERWGTGVACPLGCVTAAGADYCAECTPGETACQGLLTLRTCGTNSRWTEESCTLLCVEGAAGEAAYCTGCEIDDDCPDGGVCLLGLCQLL